MNVRAAANAEGSTYRSILLLLYRALPLLAAGLTVWVVATLVITPFAWRAFGPPPPLMAYYIYSAARTFAPCIILGMPATAVALWLRPRRSTLHAIASGLAVAAIGFAIMAIALRAGLAAVSGIAPTLVIVAAEFFLAFRLRARMQQRGSA